MPRQRSTSAAPTTVDETSVSLSLDLVAELAEPLAEYILAEYEGEDWRDSPVVEALARVAALFDAHKRSIPLPILDALRRASEAGQPIGLA